MHLWKEICDIDDDQIRTLPTGALDINIFATFFEMLKQCAQTEDALNLFSSENEGPDSKGVPSGDGTSLVRRPGNGEDK